MNHSKMKQLFCLVVALLTAFLLGTGVAEAASPKSTAQQITSCHKLKGPHRHSFPFGSTIACMNKIWTLGDHTSGSILQSDFQGVAAVSANDVWAVGLYWTSNTTIQTLIEHWDGTKWSIVSSPNPAGATISILYRVAAVSSSDVWAVGFSSNNSTTQALIEHWNGAAWSIISSPSVSSSQATLYGVVAISTSDIWAVGYFNSGQVLTEHWNGVIWSVVSNPITGGILHGVAATATNDVWAVGEYWNSNTGAEQTLAEHWNGSTWSVISSPNPAGNPTILERLHLEYYSACGLPPSVMTSVNK